VRRRRPGGGFTLVELLVASFLAGVFGLVVATSLVSTTRLANSSLDRARLESEVRELTDTTVRYLRGARPQGGCIEPPGAALNTCRRVGEVGPAVIYAASNEVWFYSYATDLGSSTSDVLRVPDCVQIVFANSVMTVRRYPATLASTYTTPSWSPTAEVMRVVEGSSTTNPFTFFASDGAVVGGSTALGSRSCVTAPSAAHRSELERIALIRVATQATSTRTEQRTEAIEVYVELPSARYQRLR
jgi:hypothetical protein